MRAFSRSAFLFLLLLTQVKAQTTFRLVTKSQDSSGSTPVATARPIRIKVPLPVPEPTATESAPIQVERRDADREDPDGGSSMDAAEAAAMAMASTGLRNVHSQAIIRSGMQVEVTLYVLGNMESKIVQRISESGKISLPLLKEIEIADLSLQAVEQRLTLAYREYYREPHVVVSFVGDEKDPLMTPWGFVMVMGTVRSPGRVAIPPTQNLTVSSAIQLAGGLDTSANEGSISVFRPSPDGNSVKRIRVDMSNLAKKGDQEEDVPLQSGDVIFVPERIF